MRTGRPNPSRSPSLRCPGLAGAAKRTAQPGTLEWIAHACCLALHSLHCTDKFPVGRYSLWPRLTLPPTALPSLLYYHDGRCGGHPGLSADP